VCLNLKWTAWLGAGVRLGWLVSTSGWLGAGCTSLAGWFSTIASQPFPAYRAGC